MALGTILMRRKAEEKGAHLLRATVAGDLNHIKDMRSVRFRGIGRKRKKLKHNKNKRGIL